MAAHGESFDLILGRRTCDLWSEFWPKVPGSPIGDRLNAATKFVATRQPESLGWSPFEGFAVLLGTGKRFFAEGTPGRALALVSTQATPSGVILNHYQTAGLLKAA